MRRRRPRRGRTPQAMAACLAACPPPLRALARRVSRQRPPCLLCGSPYHALGLFVPWHPQAWGIAAGWHAGCAYGLCVRCVALPDRDAQVEAALWRDRHRAAAPWN
jgi:hypothetical protein